MLGHSVSPYLYRFWGNSYLIIDCDPHTGPPLATGKLAWPQASSDNAMFNTDCSVNRMTSSYPARKLLENYEARKTENIKISGREILQSEL
jgi:hypothetical protein